MLWENTEEASRSQAVRDLAGTAGSSIPSRPLDLQHTRSPTSWKCWPTAQSRHLLHQSATWLRVGHCSSDPLRRPIHMSSIIASRGNQLQSAVCASVLPGVRRLEFLGDPIPAQFLSWLYPSSPLPDSTSSTCLQQEYASEETDFTE